MNPFYLGKKGEWTITTLSCAEKQNVVTLFKYPFSIFVRILCVQKRKISMHLLR